LSVVDSATLYLWLLPIRHKTAEVVAARLFDEVIARVSVPSTILTNSRGEFLGEVVELLYKRLGMMHLKTSAYRPQTNAKCEHMHFSMHNMITKLVGDKHERWPDLLGTVALAYSATVHTIVQGTAPMNCFTHSHRLVRWMHWLVRRCQSLQVMQMNMCYKPWNAYKRLLNLSAIIQADKFSE